MKKNKKIIYLYITEVLNWIGLDWTQRNDMKQEEVKDYILIFFLVCSVGGVQFNSNR
jgi:hypothetical protein